MGLALIPTTDDDDDEPVTHQQPSSLIAYAELPVYGVPPPDRKWIIDQIIRELDNGQFANSGPLGDAIMRDARIMGAYEQRNAGLFGSPLEFKPPDESAKTAQIRDEIAMGWGKMFPRVELEELHRYGVTQGIGIAQKVWDTSTRPWTFTINVFHPRYYLWRWDTSSYYVMTRDNGLVRVPQRSTEWLVYTPYGYKRAFLNGRLRALVDPWMMRGWDKNDWAHWCEIHGKPIRKAIVPQLAKPEQERDFVNQIANLGNNTVIKTRQDSDGNKYDIELVEAMSMGWKGFEAMLAWCDKEISNVLLGQHMSTDGVGGLGAQEKPGSGVTTTVFRSDNEKLTECLYEQGLREYCEWNYGSPDLAPRPSYQVDPPEDEGEIAKVDQSIGAALVAFKTSGAPINIREFLGQRGYPLLTPAEEAAQKAQAMEEAQAMAAAMAPTEPADGNDKKQPPAKGKASAQAMLARLGYKAFDPRADAEDGEPIDQDHPLESMQLQRYVASGGACPKCLERDGEVRPAAAWGDDWRTHPNCQCELEDLDDPEDS